MVWKRSLFALTLCLHTLFCRPPWLSPEFFGKRSMKKRQILRHKKQCGIVDGRREGRFKFGNEYCFKRVCSKVETERDGSD